MPDLANKVIKTLNSRSNLKLPNIDDNRTSYYIPNIDKINQLGLRVNFSLEEVIIDTANFYTKNI